MSVSEKAFNDLVSTAANYLRMADLGEALVNQADAKLAAMDRAIVAAGYLPEQVVRAADLMLARQQA